MARRFQHLRITDLYLMRPFMPDLQSEMLFEDDEQGVIIQPAGMLAAKLFKLIPLSFFTEKTLEG
jgi:hypothetical protein